VPGRAKFSLARGRPRANPVGYLGGAWLRRAGAGRAARRCLRRYGRAYGGDGGGRSPARRRARPRVPARCALGAVRRELSRGISPSVRPCDARSKRRIRKLRGPAVSALVPASRAREAGRACVRAHAGYGPARGGAVLVDLSEPDAQLLPVGTIAQPRAARGHPSDTRVVSQLRARRGAARPRRVQQPRTRGSGRRGGRAGGAEGRALALLSARTLFADA